ncbi:MAG: DUF6754 domain-containing protein [Bacillota bacterium]
MLVYPDRVFALISLVVIVGAIIYSIQRARAGKTPYIRRIPGMQALEEAVGRATEMGRPIHFSPGIAGLTGETAAQTYAALEILSYVARLIARFGSRIIVTIRTAEVLPVAEEIVRQSFIAEGKVDKYDPNSCQYLSSEQFAYAAGAMGIMERQKVASNIMLGAFWAESLMFAETGRHIGAIQIAGTANLHQIQFFVAACDYTLIGEELYAGGAVASQNPIKLGSIAGQDIGKIIALAMIAIGVITETLGSHWFSSWMLK